MTLTAETWSIYVIAMIQAASRHLILDGWGDQAHSLGWSSGLEAKVEVVDCPMNHPRH